MVAVFGVNRSSGAEPIRMSGVEVPSAVEEVEEDEEYEED